MIREVEEVQPRRRTAGVGLVGAVAAVVVQVAGPGDGDAAAAGAGVLVGRAGASWRRGKVQSVSEEL